MLEPELATTLEDERLGDLSYSAQYELLYQSELDTKRVIKPGSSAAVLSAPCVCGKASRSGACTLLSSQYAMQPVAKPSKEAQSSESGAKKVLLSDVYATAKTKLFGRSWNAQDYSYTIFMLVVHGLCLLAPATFSWPMVGLFFVSYFITGAHLASSAQSSLLAVHHLHLLTRWQHGRLSVNAGWLPACHMSALILRYIMSAILICKGNTWYALKQ